jgi:ESS family glutamate:Na+ symporter
MEYADGVLHVESFLAITIGIVALFVGRRINRNLEMLRQLSIPEPVTGGLLLSILLALLFALSGVAIEFEMGFRDFLLNYFFATIGINATVADLRKGGRPLAILMLITLGYMFVQNLTGISIAVLFDVPAVLGMLGGGISLIGGHGTTIAWAPVVAENFGIVNAMEVGIACATGGLVLASLMGGPIARYLVNRHGLEPETIEPQDVGLAEDQPNQIVTYLDFLDAVLAIHVTIIVAAFFDEGLEYFDINVPFFVSCLLAGMLITNLFAGRMPRVSGMRWPNRKPAMALIADLSLGTFLAMSLMSLKLWVLIDLAGPILAMLLAQFLVAVSLAMFVVFPLMGRNYDAAVICAGFGGISLGSTPTAMANMAAVSQRYGASHQAFIVVPLVSAFFISVVNALLIPLFLRFLS